MARPAGALAGLRWEACEIIIAFFKNSAVPVLHGRGLGDKRGGSAQGILDQRVRIGRGAGGRRSPHWVSRAAPLGDSNSRMLMASVDGFLSYCPRRRENHHSQDSEPYPLEWGRGRTVGVASAFLNGTPIPET